jgi:putative hydrolase of the HAD superfamily
MSVSGPVVWSDFGGVLTPPVGSTVASYCARVGVEAARLHGAAVQVARRYGTDDIMEPLDTPLVTEAEWSRQIAGILAAQLGRDVELGDVGAAWFDGRQANAPWLAELRRLRAAGIPVGMLSNMPPSWDARWRRMVEPAEFDAVVLSFEAGCRKPAAEIFDLAAETVGAAPERCVLVDDSAANCAGAVAAGWRAVHFTDTLPAVNALRELLSVPV